MKRLFCIFAHPDDEAFGPGGSIATFAKEHEVYLICVTDGAAKRKFQPVKQNHLGEIRKEELLHSARILGIERVFFLGFQDGGICNNLYHDVALKIEEIIREYQPDTFLTFENKGVSGHIDHIAVSLITTYLFKREPYAQTLMYFCESEKVVSQIRDDYFIYMPEGYKRDNVDQVINTESVWEEKVKAMQAHKSQQHDIDMILHIISHEPKEEYFLVKEK